MSFCVAHRLGAASVALLLASSVPAVAQGRFEATGHETIAAVAGLHVITIRDQALDACYTLFMMDARPVVTPRPEGMTKQQAADVRDRQLAALATDFSNAQVNVQAGPLSASPLPYQWEADKVKSEYERQLRDWDFGRLEDALAQLVAQPRLAVAGPSPCH